MVLLGWTEDPGAALAKDSSRGERSREPIFVGGTILTPDEARPRVGAHVLRAGGFAALSEEIDPARLGRARGPRRGSPTGRRVEVER